MSATSVEMVSSPNNFAELQLTGIEPAILVTGPSNYTTEVRPLRITIKAIFNENHKGLSINNVSLIFVI